MTAFMSPIRAVPAGLSGLLHELHRIEDGSARVYPFYCVLLATNAGSDQYVSDFVRDHWVDLDAMTARTCLVFCLRDRDEACPNCGYPLEYCLRTCSRGAAPHGQTRWTDHDFDISEIYRVAELFGVSFSALPSAVFFTSPRDRRQIRRLRLVDFACLGETQSPQVALADAFRSIADALRRSADAPPDERLIALEDELVVAHRRLRSKHGCPQPSGFETISTQVERAANTADSVATFASVARSVSSALLRLIGPH